MNVADCVADCVLRALADDAIHFASADEVFRRYSFGPELGRGTSATVCAATTSGGSLVALKSFSKERLAWNGAAKERRRAERLANEVRALALLSHPYIARYHEVLVTQQRIYIVSVSWLPLLPFAT